MEPEPKRSLQKHGPLQDSRTYRGIIPTWQHQIIRLRCECQCKAQFRAGARWVSLESPLFRKHCQENVWLTGQRSVSVGSSEQIDSLFNSKSLSVRSCCPVRKAPCVSWPVLSVLLYCICLLEWGLWLGFSSAAQEARSKPQWVCGRDESLRSLSEREERARPVASPPFAFCYAARCQ